MIENARNKTEKLIEMKLQQILAIIVENLLFNINYNFLIITFLSLILISLSTITLFLFYLTTLYVS